MRRPEESLSRIPSASQSYSTLAEAALEKQGGDTCFMAYSLSVNAVTPQPSASAKPQGPNSSQDAEFGQALWEHTPRVWGGAPGCPTAAESHQCAHLNHCWDQHELHCWASPQTHTHFGTYHLCVYVGKLSTLQSTTLPVHRVSRNV